MKKTFPFLLTVLLLMSCKKNKEFAFNENISGEFLQEMNALDSLQINYFSDSSALSKPPSAENSTEMKDALKLSENSSAGFKNITAIPVSAEAMPFYTAVTEYLGYTKAQGNLARDFFQETDPLMRKAYFEKIQLDFKKLSSKPDSILAIQKIYLNKVGLK